MLKKQQNKNNKKKKLRKEEKSWLEEMNKELYLEKLNKNVGRQKALKNEKRKKKGFQKPESKLNKQYNNRGYIINKEMKQLSINFKNSKSKDLMKESN